MKFTVKRSEWSRGKINEPSILLNQDGNKCCLGFLSLACGYSTKEIDNKLVPQKVAKYANKNLFPITIVADINVNYGTKIIDYIVNVNDDVELSDKDREQKLIRIFAEVGIEVSFED